MGTDPLLIFLYSATLSFSLKNCLCLNWDGPWVGAQHVTVIRYPYKYKGQSRRNILCYIVLKKGTPLTFMNLTFLHVVIWKLLLGNYICYFVICRCTNLPCAQWDQCWHVEVSLPGSEILIHISMAQPITLILGIWFQWNHQTIIYLQK